MENYICHLDFCRRFSKLQKATIFFVMTLCLSVRLHEHLDCQWMDFHEIFYSNIFRKSVEKIQVSLKHDRNKEYFTRRPMHIYGRISLNSS